MDPTNSLQSPIPPLTAPRACDNCRTRKIRCDRGAVCSNCRAAGLICRTSTQRSREQKDRIQITRQYETKIDRIEDRLATIEQLLRASVNPPLPTTHSNPAPARSPHNLTVSPVNPNQLEDELVAQIQTAGDSEIQADSRLARSALEQIVRLDRDVQQDPQLMSALESLRSIANPVQHAEPGLDESTSSVLRPKYTLEHYPPRWGQVSGLLAEAEKTKPMAFQPLPAAIFTNFCQKTRLIYQRGESGSLADRLLVYAGMANLCSESSSWQEGDLATYHHKLGTSFSYLLLQALAAFPVTTPASVETVEALLVATLTMVGVCKPSLSWSLSCTAIRMCQMLGYNRLARLGPPTDPMFNRKIMVFWNIYVMDRSNSFRLGYAPAIQDYDIDTPMMTVSDECPPAVLQLVRFWVECGNVQGRIYAQLYGPTASSLTGDERAQIAEGFVDELEQIYQQKNMANANFAFFLGHRKHESGQRLWSHADDIMRCAISTTALCVIPSGHPRCLRAIEVARECLRKCRDVNKDHSANIYSWTTFVHWVLLRLPATAFTGIFSSVISNPLTSSGDLQLLEDVVASLDEVREFSSGIEKFYRLGIILSKAARAYVRAKEQLHATVNNTYHSVTSPGSPSQFLQPAIAEFDEYFFTLGFSAPAAGAAWTDTNSIAPSAAGFANGSGHQEQLFDMSSAPNWYSSNALMYDLLERNFDSLDEMDDVLFRF